MMIVDANVNIIANTTTYILIDNIYNDDKDNRWW